MNNIEKYIIKENNTLIEAMRQLDSTERGILFVTDEKGCLTGCLTDGDIRRWLIQTGDLNGCVSSMMNHNPRYVFEGESSDGFEMLKDHRIMSFPILGQDRQIKDIRFGNHEKRFRNDKHIAGVLKNTPVIVMAGGKGTRLFPYTKILPKPLIPVGDVPILERILDRFFRYGVEEFYLTVNYKREMIKSYFAEARRPYRIRYVDEDMPLGTAGSIGLIREKFTSPVIITNCDSLIEADYENLILHHKEVKNDMTIVSSLKNTSIPYGVLHPEAYGVITSMEEKPNVSYFINTGMYVVSPEYLEWIPKGKFFHMTDLANKMIIKGKRVGMYPISENSFLDMGELEEMKKMEERISMGLLDK